MMGKRFAHRNSRAWLLVFLTVVLLAVLFMFPGSGINAKAEPTQDVQTDTETTGENASTEEYGMGCLPADPAEYYQMEPPSTKEALASSVDLSTELPPVGFQGSQGSCTAWAAGYYYKTFWEHMTNDDWPLNDSWYQFSPSYIYNQINGGVDNGSSIPSAMALLTLQGCVDIAEFPYNQYDWTTQPNASQIEAAKQFRIPASWGYIWNWPGNPPYSTWEIPIIDACKAFLAQGNMIVMAIPIYQDFPGWGPNTNYYSYNGASPLIGWHAVCICGYDDNAGGPGLGGFKMVNSWGSNWNYPYGGYVYLSYLFVQFFAREAWVMSDMDSTPVIDSITEVPAWPISYYTIDGNNFGADRRLSKVTINDVEVFINLWKNESIMMSIPGNATSGPLSLYTWDGKKVEPEPWFQIGDLFVQNVRPGIGYNNNNNLRVTIEGSNFEPGANVRLEDSLGREILKANNEVVHSLEEITCSFDLRGIAPDLYNVVVENADGETAMLFNGLQVVECGAGGGMAVLMLGISLGMLTAAETTRRRLRRKRKA